MNLLISETLSADAALGRALSPVEDGCDSFASMTADDESVELEGRMATGRESAWYELRLSALRQAILGIF